LHIDLTSKIAGNWATKTEMSSEFRGNCLF
jgi:hypothetical protein